MFKTGIHSETRTIEKSYASFLFQESSLEVISSFLEQTLTNMAGEL